MNRRNFFTKSLVWLGGLFGISQTRAEAKSAPVEDWRAEWNAREVVIEAGRERPIKIVGSHGWHYVASEDGLECGIRRFARFKLSRPLDWNDWKNEWKLFCKSCCEQLNGHYYFCKNDNPKFIRKFDIWESPKYPHDEIENDAYDECVDPEMQMFIRKSLSYANNDSCLRACHNKFIPFDIWFNPKTGEWGSTERKLKDNA